MSLTIKINNNISVLIFSGNSNIPLAQEIAERLGLSLSKRDLTRFADGEINCKVIYFLKSS